METQQDKKRGLIGEREDREQKASRGRESTRGKITRRDSQGKRRQNEEG